MKTEILKNMEIYKELGKPIFLDKENKTKLLQEKRKKKYYFIIREPFGDFHKGQKIVKEELIDQIEKQRLTNLVLKVNI